MGGRLYGRASGAEEVMAPSLERLNRWYVENCNEDWEHGYGVKIETLDNPGWLVHFDLQDTRLEQCSFNEISQGCLADGTPDHERWIHCRVVGKRWTGAGDPSQLELILEAFLDWSDETGR